MNSKEDLTIDRIETDVHTALKVWHKNSDESTLDYLFLFHQLQREGYNMQEATNKLLTEALNNLQKRNARYAKLLSERFIEGRQVNQLAAQYGVGSGMIYRRQREGIHALAEELLEMEVDANKERYTLLEKRLPPASTPHVIGVDEQLTQLKEVLIQGESPWVLLLAGLGGIGKTTLADTLTRHLIRQGWFDDVGWISAKSSALNSIGKIQSIQQPTLSVEALVEALVVQLMGDVFKQDLLPRHEAFTTLLRSLKEKPHLIVVDNLETVEDINALLPTLHRLANPSKFLLTSRDSLFGEGIYHFQLPGLQEADALELVRQEAKVRNLPYLVGASNEDLKPIYDVVGGNPLALRLVVGQANFQPLDVILSDLAANRGKSVENLYSYIYQRAWDKMEENTRRLFLFMPLVTDLGGDWNHIAAVTQLDASDLRESLQFLVSMNLIDVRPGLKNSLYSIHNLTRTFLETGPGKWL